MNYKPSNFDQNKLEQLILINMLYWSEANNNKIRELYNSVMPLPITINTAESRMGTVS